MRLEAPTAPLTIHPGPIVRALALCLAGAAGSAYAQLSQSPLFLSGGNVPGNLALVPSVEWPTTNSVANLGDYSASKTYVGYFDSAKCYRYHYSDSEPERHFYPVGKTSNRQCAGDRWSGNFLNWAATQTIDAFRSALTGGYRVRDTPTETWLEKARHDGQGREEGARAVYPIRRLPASGSSETMVGGATPFGPAGRMTLKIGGLGSGMRFQLGSDVIDKEVVPYNPAVAVSLEKAYDVSIRVKVCDSNAGLESNCRRYSQGWKPEGLIQQYATDIRFSIFGYLNDSNKLRDGGVLRARQKFVGPKAVVPGVGKTTNPRVEWDTTTGVLLDNPDPADAVQTTEAFGVAIRNSGVINYVNKFGQLTDNKHKSFDPVSELFYSAIRYFKNQGNVPEYSTPTPAHDPSADAATRAQWTDGFPVIDKWDDPIQYACQKNMILGIGDVYTHRDKNLPGATASADEPAKPAVVSADRTVDVVAATRKIAELEGITIDYDAYYGSAYQNSAFLAGLAYDAHTRDMRGDLTGTQTVSTFWIDVLQTQTLEPRERNQYWLAAKYGGFTPRPPAECEQSDFTPPNATYCKTPAFGDPYARTEALPERWWHTNKDTLKPFGRAKGDAYLRADNYYGAGDAAAMVDSLTAAFAVIAEQKRSTAASLTANSSRIGSDSALFQAVLDNERWSGDLLAKRLSAGQSAQTTTAWSAAEQLDARDYTGRRILTVKPPTKGANDTLRSTTGVSFEWDSLATAQQEALRKASGSTTLVSKEVGQQRLEFLRGDRSLEQTTEHPDNPFRTRDSRLGDMVNSDPQFVYQQDFGYSRLAAAAGFASTDAGKAYTEFRASKTYRNRRPLVVVGANDGMLHGFDGGLDAPKGGRELFAFVPYGVFDNLYELALPAYRHRYYVDGTPRVGDAWLGEAPGWRTLVVGTTGAGGRSVFALDVTDPENVGTSQVLWEFSAPEMGYTVGQPAVVALPNGRFGVVVTSGYDTGAADGHIWILDAADGSVIRDITVADSGELGQPLVVDLDTDRVADRIYAGDTKGNLWRFDLSGKDPKLWRAPNKLRTGQTTHPLFVATDAGGTPQPITAPLSSAFNRDGEHMVFFGTGSFQMINDEVVGSTPQVNSFYGIIDRGAAITGRTALREQEILQEFLPAVTALDFQVRVLSARELDADHEGWFIDLQWKRTNGGPGPAGERIVARAVLRRNQVIFSTLVPSADPCVMGGKSWIMAVDLSGGARLPFVFFDVNGDSVFDAKDMVEVTDENGEVIRVPITGTADGEDGSENSTGIVKTGTILSSPQSGAKVLCYAGTETEDPKCISLSSSPDAGRQAWRQVR